MQTAKLFKNGQSQAVRLPQAFRLPGTECRIRRQGQAIVLEPLSDDWDWVQQAIGGTIDDKFEQAALDRPGPEANRPVDLG